MWCRTSQVLPAVEQAGRLESDQAPSNMMWTPATPSSEAGSAMEFTFTLTGWGWPQARLRSGHADVTLGCGYCTDATGDLLSSIELMLEGANEARFSWDCEPIEYRWIFSRQGSTATLCILGFDDIYESLPDSSGNLVFKSFESLNEMATGIAAATTDFCQTADSSSTTRCGTSLLSRQARWSWFITC